MKEFTKQDIGFIMKTELFIGVRVMNKLIEYLKSNMWDKIGVVIDKGFYENNDYSKKIIELLNNHMELVILLINEMPEPTYDYLNKIKTKFEKCELDCFVGIGGGSTMDLSKGLATLKTNHGDAINYRGFGKVKNLPLPVVAIPTTAGSGSEVTPYAVFIDTDENWKFGINSEYNYPKLALLDPNVLNSCPDSVFASSGMDAMTHTLESFVANNATTLSRMFSYKAFKLLYENLVQISRGNKSIEVKMGLLVGASCAGIALMNSGAGPAGALSYPLGVYFSVPHGIAGSVFLPGIIKYNVDNGYNDYYKLYDLVFEEKNISNKKKSYIFAEKITALSQNLGIPTNLKGFGVISDEDANKIIDNSMQLEAAFDQNPVDFKQNQVVELVNSLR